MIIVISGTPGSGKSTIAKAVAEKLGYKFHSMGSLQRMYAAEKGISIAELGKLEQTDETIDREIDEKQKALGEKEDNFIIDSRLGAFFIPKAQVKIFLDASPKIRAKRIISHKRGVERYKNIDEAVKKMKEREEINKKRYMKLYDADHFDKNLYNQFIDTTELSIEEVIAKVMAIVNQKL